MGNRNLEIFLAVFIGILIGIASTSGFWYFKNKSLLTVLDKTRVETSNKPATPPANSPQLVLEVQTKDDSNIVNSAIYELTAKTGSGFQIILTHNGDDYVEKADGNGSYAKKLELIEGLNIVSITISDSNGNYLQKQVKLVYIPK